LSTNWEIEFSKRFAELFNSTQDTDVWAMKRMSFYEDMKEFIHEVASNEYTAGYNSAVSWQKANNPVIQHTHKIYGLGDA